MRVLLITDIHANFTALEAVVEDAGPVDAVWCLGDVVGYGPSPERVLRLGGGARRDHRGREPRLGGAGPARSR